MFGFFKKGPTIADTLEDYNRSIRIIRVVLFTELIEELKSKISDVDLAKTLAAQMVNYMLGEDLDESYDTADKELKEMIDQIRDKIVPYSEEKLKRDLKTRELIVYSLRMKDILMFFIEGPSDKALKDVEISDEELKLLNVTRADEEASKKIFGNSGSKWLENPLEKKIAKLLYAYGGEFPEAVNPEKYNNIVKNYYKERYKSNK